MTSLGRSYRLNQSIIVSIALSGTKKNNIRNIWRWRLSWPWNLGWTWESPFEFIHDLYIAEIYKHGTQIFAIWFYLHSLIHSELAPVELCKVTWCFVVVQDYLSSSKFAPIESPYAISYCFFFIVICLLLSFLRYNDLLVKNMFYAVFTDPVS